MIMLMIMAIPINQNHIIIIKVYLTSFPRFKTFYDQMFKHGSIFLPAEDKAMAHYNIPISFITVIENELIKYNLC